TGGVILRPLSHLRHIFLFDPCRAALVLLHYEPDTDAHLRHYVSIWSFRQWVDENEAPLSTPILLKERLSLKGPRAMHSFGRHQHSSRGKASAKESPESQATKGLILSGGWRYDLH